MNQQWEKKTYKALLFLKSQQQSDGSFLSYSSPQPYKFIPSQTYKTTFANSTILYCLASLSLQPARDISDALASYISAQANATGTYNYWDIHSQEYTQFPYPNDLDDTFCTLTALSAHNATHVNGRVLAQATYTLLQTENQPGGPYTTWITRDARREWNDVDIAVNANVLYFLKTQAIFQPKLEQYITRTIKAHNYYSPYYPSQYAVLYFVCRATDVSNYPAITSFAHRLAAVSPPQSVVELAFLICVLVITDQIAESLIYKKQLIQLQKRDGSWAASAFCIDPRRNQQRHYSGSSALSTALALHALHLTPHFSKSEPMISIPPLTYIAATHNIALKQIMHLSEITRTPLSQQLHHYATGSNADEIIASAYLFDRSLPAAVQPLSWEILYGLSAANLYGWIAFTIYDDFIDDEGDPHLLPLANIAQRQALVGFSKISPDNIKFQTYIEKIFDRIDAASAWELKHCRLSIDQQTIDVAKLPHFSDMTHLGEKSIGHILPLLGIVVLRGHNVGSKQFHNLETALIHYLVARQLHDDIHDWKEDLARGHISFVVASLLEKQHISGTHTIDSLIPKLQDSYWRQTLPQMCIVVQSHLQQARRALTKISFEHTAVSDLLNRLEAATLETLSLQKNTLLFLDTYAELTKDRDRTSYD